VELMSQRLRLRLVDEGDRAALAAILGDAAVMRFVGAGAVGSEEADEWLAEAMRAHRHHDLGPFSVCLAQGATVVGYCGIWIGEDTGELGLNYALAPPHWGHGLAREAARAVLDQADKKLDIIRATADPENACSLRILERLGFRPTHTRTDVHGLATVLFTRQRPPSSPPADAQMGPALPRPQAAMTEV
jgi:ribosomal-protein-alanine N-acetyltransferase